VVDLDIRIIRVLLAETPLTPQGIITIEEILIKVECPPELDLLLAVEEMGIGVQISSSVLPIIKALLDHLVPAIRLMQLL
jgi:hypothetical protein